MNLTTEQIDFLFSPKAIRERCESIWNLTKDGLTNFEIHEEKIQSCAEYVLEVIKTNYPTLEIPFHSRWGHFQVGEIDRLLLLKEKLKDYDQKEKSRCKLDLVIVSVLLDAGAGKDWQYEDPYNQQRVGRSEGLALASFDMFMRGTFSNDSSARVDADAIINFTVNDLKNGFQVSDSNPLLGLEGRVNLLNNLGKTLKSKSDQYPGERPGGLLDTLERNHGMNYEVQDILNFVLFHLGPIWPSRLEANGTNLGDTWHYPLSSQSDDFQNLVVFHKLSQWLTYSLVDPLLEAGHQITGAEKLTGLAEYRNGGLFLDSGVLSAKDPNALTYNHEANSAFIIEWRALTVCLLDRVGDIVREKLNKTADEFPLAKVLEGGTWHAGRKIAKEFRSDGTPPVNIKSDGTVF